jgi:hypothetical protein
MKTTYQQYLDTINSYGLSDKFKTEEKYEEYISLEEDRLSYSDCEYLNSEDNLLDRLQELFEGENWEGGMIGWDEQDEEEGENSFRETRNMFMWRMWLFDLEEDAVIQEFVEYATQNRSKSFIGSGIGWYVMNDWLEHIEEKERIH